MDQLPSTGSARFSWDPASTFIKPPPFFDGLTIEPAPLADIRGARVLALLGDSVTTDHISPIGVFPVDGEAGRYLTSQGVPPKEFGSYMERRVNHHVMVRGTFANLQLQNE